MARTFVRQETEIRQSDLYDDTIGPASTMESAAVSIEDDLNALRSMANVIRNNQVGNWFDDLVAPATFELGAKRGVQGVNNDLHDLERKRVLVEVFNPNDVTIGTTATGVLTGTVNFADTETVTIGVKVYQFQTSLTNVDGNVLIGGSLAASLANLVAAINLDAGAGSLYAAATTLNADVYASSDATTMTVRAKVGGPAANSTATTETATNASWGAATLSGGAVTNVAVLARAAELPGDTTLAIGVVTTLGTVVASHGGSFGAHSLAAVAGANISSPKNLVPIVDYLTHDPILSSGRRVYGLLQSESTTDGSTAGISTPDRLQISFVRLDASGHIFEAVPAADVSGLVVHYSSVQRKALEDFNEQDFLRGATIDVPSSTTVSRQVAYDIQGVTPVELLNNAFLDLGTGFKTSTRDALDAELFTVVEGSAGGTTEVQVKADVDIFNIDAVINDYANGLRVATAGERINVGETAGLIESTGANDLRVLGAGELFLDDGNQTGSTWTQTGIKLSDTTAEWDAFETAFGEVSLLAGIVAAFNSSSEVKSYHNVTANVNADTDISLADGNIDVAFPDMTAGSFLQDYDVYFDGRLQRPGVDSSANNDYYPGTTLATAAKLKFEFKVKTGDVICIIKKA